VSPLKATAEVRAAPAPWEPPPAWWPLIGEVRRVEAGGHHWWVQIRHRQGRHQEGQPAAQAPWALLLHGTGASSHSFEPLAPLLSQHFNLCVPDLPGHAFTQALPAQGLPGAAASANTNTNAHSRDGPLSLPRVAQSLAQMLARLNIQPSLVIGHSAGAAIALQACWRHDLQPRWVVSLNGAVLPLQGPLTRWFSPVAQMLVAQPLVPWAFSHWARLPGSTQRLLAGTGSTISAQSERCYAHLVRRPSHAAGALALMASWDLQALADALPSLRIPVLLLAATADRMLPAQHAREIAARMPHAELAWLEGLGHLAHEENPQTVFEAVLRVWKAPPEERGGAEENEG
jgi:magnesium chelatase accessory protein